MNITKVDVFNHCALRRASLPGRRLYRIIRGALALAATLLWIGVAAAADDTWTGDSANSANWTDASNWNPGVPGEGDDLIFGASPRTDSTVDDFFDLSSITFTADAPAYTITVLPLSGLTLSNPASLSRQTLGPIEDGVLLGNASKNLGLIILGGAKSPEETLGGLLIVIFSL